MPFVWKSSCTGRPHEATFTWLRHELQKELEPGVRTALPNRRGASTRTRSVLFITLVTASTAYIILTQLAK
ncbi:hypothetical protein P171DRAFT_87910 [Karstenula rhodostoma CBS 690.94]|uniref:Uncharacterized protein n=1 Tax=Karstenula rhodostoma CBS 690.94 TaxID=1392251 RepID=A0A9P4PC04_9PLEO|nr:hypothetical protein P171DRAFT_87910 [Karstenula rhodostoma CBS 690.94]